MADYTSILVDQGLHEDYGLTYPVTYTFLLPLNAFNLRAFKRHNDTQQWIRLVERTDEDFFNAVECVRFDYANHKAYVSVGFSADTDEIQVKFIDMLGITVPADFQSIPKYYDNRNAVVMVTSDGWGVQPEYNDPHEYLCNLMRDVHIWLGIAISTRLPGMTDQTWANIQKHLDLGYIEPTAHSRTHKYPPYVDVYGEVQGCKEDIISALNLPPLFKKGTKEYLWTWLEPYGCIDDDIRQVLGQSKFLVNRSIQIKTSLDFSVWDVSEGLYGRAGISAKLEQETLEQLNAKFDKAVSQGLTYHLMCHPQYADWSEGNYQYDHINYIKGHKNLWYVAMGHSYVYRLVYDRLGTDVYILKVDEENGSMLNGGCFYDAIEYALYKEEIQ